MKNIKLTPWLLKAIQNGEAIMFLGAGSTIGARRQDGKSPSNASQLRDLLSDTFLGGKRKEWPLDRVADYAKNISNLGAVQSFIREQFEDLKPAPFHYLIPKFRWFAIVTTNYDLVLERTYEKAAHKLQNLAPIIRDGDNFSQKLIDPNLVPYLKLHGCISVVNDPSLPLILASEEYAKYEKNRVRLFSHLKDWGREHPIIFCGYQIADPNIQHILFDLADMGISRPLYALVNPSLDELDETVWRGRRFDTVKADFETLLKYLDETIPPNARVISALRKTEQLSIARWFATHVPPSEELIVYLDAELEHVFDGTPTEGVSPTAFYRGLTNSWEVLTQNLDVRRRVTDDILLNGILDDSGLKPVRCFLLKGHAGSGKNITLKRTAWEAASEHDQLILYLREGGIIRKELIHELYRLTRKRLTLFINDIIKILPETIDLIKFATRHEVRLTLIFGARTNEWNVYGGDLAPKLDGEYDLRDLSEQEIRSLLQKLEQHNCLGHLKNLNEEERMDALKLTAERQLLVALHEATSGKSFEELIFDEYKNIVPAEARILYLDICTLHRLRVSVRAGLISRISGISFEQFREILLEPLEHVVRYYTDPATRDFAYRSRHPVIAKFVFEQALKRPSDRADQIIRMLTYLNVDYRGDEEAFGQLIRGRELAELFADRSLADQIYKTAEQTGADVAYIQHQRAIFELHHPNGSTRRAMDALKDAEKHAKRGTDAIAHTRAMALRKMASQASSLLEKEKYRRDAKEILQKQLQHVADAYPFSGLGDVLLDELRDKLREPLVERQEPPQDRLKNRVVTELIGETEEVISRGLQKFPGDEYLLTLQANLSNALSYN